MRLKYPKTKKGALRLRSSLLIRKISPKIRVGNELPALMRRWNSKPCLSRKTELYLKNELVPHSISDGIAMMNLTAFSVHYLYLPPLNSRIRAYQQSSIPLCGRVVAGAPQFYKQLV